MLVGALALAVVGMTLIVLTGNKVSDRNAEIADLKAQESAAQQRAAEFAPFTQFSSLEQSRVSTVQSLADSRFDWERTLRELALVIPSDIWLTKLIGAAGTTDTSGAATGTGGGNALAPSDVPSLSLTGCGAGQQSVAGFLAALRDIDGVTRVGLSSSERPTSAVSGEGGGGGDCRTRDFIALFEIVVAFDAVPDPAVPGAAPVAPADAAAAAAAAAPEGGTPPATESTPTSDTGT
jgi:Tfp pilus assembly protein PilN